MTPALPAHSTAQTTGSHREPDDYDAILAAVSETPRGRWFLAEYARRNRTADTTAILDEIGRLETLMGMADPRLPVRRADAALTEIATVLALSADGHDKAGDGLTPDVVAQLALSVGQSGEAIREALLTVRGAMVALRDNKHDPARAARFTGAIDRHLAAIDDTAGTIIQTSQRVEALAQVISQIRARLRLVLRTAGMDQSAKQREPAEAEMPLATPVAKKNPAPAALAPDPAPADATGEAEPPPAFEQVWDVPAAPSHARLRHVAGLMQDKAQTGDDILAADGALVALAQSARTAHAGRSLAELDRLSYTERAALFA